MTTDTGSAHRFRRRFRRGFRRFPLRFPLVIAAAVSVWGQEWIARGFLDAFGNETVALGVSEREYASLYSPSIDDDQLDHSFSMLNRIYYRCQLSQGSAQC